MKMYCISHDIDTAVGLKLTGIETVVAQEKTKSDSEIDKILQDETIGILVYTDKIYEFSKEKLDFIKQNRKTPLLVQIQ